MQTKPLYQSKTLWVQLIAVLSILFPAVQEWVAKNPVEITAIFTAVNTLVRFFTQDKIKPFKSESGINLPVLGILVVGLGFIGLSLTSCTPTAYQVNTLPYAEQIENSPESVMVKSEHVTPIGGFQAEFGARVLTDQGEIDVSDRGVSGTVVVDLRSKDAQPADKPRNDPIDPRLGKN